MYHLPKIRVLFDRHKRATTEVAAPLSIYVYYQRRRKFLSTGIRLTIDQWNEQRQRIQKHPQASMLQVMLAKALDRVYFIVEKLLQINELSMERLEDEYYNKGTALVNFFDFAAKEVEKKDLSSSRKRTIRSALVALEGAGKLPALQEISSKDIERFEAYLSKQGLKASTKSTYHTIIKNLLDTARRRGLLEVDPYLDYKPQKSRNEVIKYLNKEQVQRFLDYQPKDKREQQAKDFYILQMYTGLSYIDAAALDLSSFDSPDSNGIRYATLYRKKTGVPFLVGLPIFLVSILERHKGKAPSLAYDTYNNTIRKIGKALNIPFSLTSHTARHTFATTITLLEGVPLEVVSKMLGHTDISTTQKYAKVLNISIIEQYTKVIQKKANDDLEAVL